MKTRGSLLAVSLALVAVASTAVARASDPPAAPVGGAPAGAFRDTTDVKVVEIPVNVIRNGEPVRGLVADDFEVFAGKQPQRIVGFDMVDAAKAEAIAGPSGAPPVPSAGRRHFLFLFDLSQSTPTSIGRAQRAALALLDDLGPSDLAAVATYSPARGPRVLLAFSPDRQQVRLALQTLGSTELVESRPDWLGLSIGSAKGELADASRAVHTGKREQSTRELLAQVDTENMEDLQPLQERVDTNAARDRASVFAKGVADLAALLGSVAGRKQVLLLSEGFDADILTGRGGREPNVDEAPKEASKDVYRSDFDIKFGSSRLQRQMRDLVAAMQHADCAIHSIDIAGLESGGRAVDDSGASATMQRTGAGEDSLFFLAKETGGTFHRGENDLHGALADVLRATSVTYVLTIVPEHVKTGKDGFVPIEVKVHGGGIVLARAGYSTAAPAMGSQAAMTERLGIGAQVIEGKAGGAIQSSVLGITDADTGNAYAVVAVDGASLLASSAGDTMVSGEVTVYAFGRDGGIAAVARQLATFDVAKVGDRLRSTGFEIFAPLQVPAGGYALRALVRNTLSGAYGIATGSLDVPVDGAATPLAAVFAQPPGQDWLLLRNGGAAAAYPFAVAGTLVTPALAPHLHAGDAPTLWLRAPEGTTLAATVRRSDGTAAGTAKLEVLGKQPLQSGVALLARVATPALAAGSYTLELRGAQGAVALPFTVE